MPNSGTSGTTVATIAFKEKVDGDCLANSTLQELQRRLEITFEGRQESDIWSEQTEPTDLTLIWWPKDPTSGTRIGQPRVYDSATSTWIPLGGDGTVTTPVKLVRTGFMLIPAAGVHNVNFDSLETEAYHINLTPATYNGATWNAAPGTITNFGWLVTNRAANQFSVQFYGVPAGGIAIFWEASEI